MNQIINVVSIYYLLIVEHLYTKIIIIKLKIILKLLQIKLL